METKPSTARVALKWGMISAVVSILYTVVMILIDRYQDPSMSWINFIFGFGVSIVILVLAMKEFRTLNGGFLSFGQGLGLGTLLSAISGVVSGLFTLIYVKFIDSSVLSKSLDAARVQWEEQGMSEAQMEQAENMAGMFMSPAALFLVSVLGSVFIGFLLSLVIAAVLKKDRPVFG